MGTERPHSAWVSIETESIADIWEPFLTARDREHLRVSGFAKLAPLGLGRRPALLIVDTHYAALGVERQPILDSVRDWPLSCGLDGWEAIDRTAGLLACARAHGVEVVFVNAMPGVSPAHPHRSALFEPSTRLSNELRARGHEIVDELRPLTGEPVIGKAGPSAFHGTPLVSLLNQWRVDTIIVCGETTSGCVRATVVDGASLRYRVGVVADCCFDRTQAAHAVNLFDMHHKYGDVIAAAEATTYFALVAGSNHGESPRPGFTRAVQG